MHISSYPQIYNLGHAAVARLLDGSVLVEEKIDGSQFSFGVIDNEIVLRSKGAELYPDAPEKMFFAAVETVRRLASDLHPSWIYRSEYLAKPKHNAFAYNRIPEQHLIIFDINTGLESYLTPEQKRVEAARLGLECVPILHRGIVQDINQFRTLLKTPSVLGGQQVEGVVIKPEVYDQFGLDKKVIMGKFVSEAFKETNAKEWTKANPSSKDIVQQIIEMHTTQARWMKAVQHLRESGQLENSPRDIGALMKEVPDDLRKEEESAIKETLFTWAWPQIRRSVARGLPEWYKEELLKRQFGTEE